LISAEISLSYELSKTFEWVGRDLENPTMKLNSNQKETRPMLHALRSILYAVVAVGLLWSANAQALPAGANHRASELRNHINLRAHSITLSARSNRFDFWSLFSERGDACAKSLWGCLQSGRIALGTEDETDKTPDPRVRVHGLRHWEPLTIRPEQGPTHPIPEPHAALIFAAGIGFAAIRLRR
jgi:hypothetical protein